MKALRYLLMVMAVMGVLSVSAQTPKYGTTYNPGNERAAYGVQVNTQMPEATIGSTRSDFMSSGSTLPQAAVTGAITTLDNNGASGRPGNIRRGWGTGGESGEPGDRPEPYETPIGDAMLPLALCALAFAIGKWLARTKPLR